MNKVASELPETAIAPGKTFDVVCVGNALMDHLAHAEIAILEMLGFAPGAMTLVDIATTERIKSVLGDGRLVPGGTVTNTAVGIASLGGSPAFVGAVATDDLGDRYATDLEACGVHAVLQRFPFDPDGDEAATGRCYVIVTPDAERTMATALGVGGRLDSAGIDPRVISGADLVYFDGYVLDLPDATALVARVVEAARSSNTRIALGLADALLVERHRRVIERLVSEIVDYVFANEREILALTGAKDVKQALLSVGRPGLVVAVTRGGEGATLGSEDGIVDLRAHEVDKVVDVTGAGDLFAAGFCFGVTHGHDPVSAARLGMIAASEVIGHLGARPETSLAELARLQGLL
ncbi:MAG TPA: adenosine kinase [Acidimicrobiales bacterium]|nr:adenosine kinase [Acidimicrobiales bacterium]